MGEEENLKRANIRNFADYLPSVAEGRVKNVVVREEQEYDQKRESIEPGVNYSAWNEDVLGALSSCVICDETSLIDTRGEMDMRLDRAGE